MDKMARHKILIFKITQTSRKILKILIMESLKCHTAFSLISIITNTFLTPLKTHISHKIILISNQLLPKLIIIRRA
jgi:hypothetical protein